MKLRCLGDFVELRQGLAINKGSAHLVSDTQDITYCYPLLRIADMMDSNFSKFVSKDVNSSVIANPQDIIYTRTGQIGLAFRGMQGVVHNNSFIVSLKTDELEKDYLYTVLNSNFVKKQANSQAKNSVQPDLTHTMFKSIVIPVPDSREEQNRISKIINNINQKIQTNIQINQELEAMAKTLYDYWFVQFDFPDQNGKPYKSSGGKMVYHPELKREIPEGWGVEKIEDIAQTGSGGTPKSTNVSYYSNGEIPWINSGELEQTVITSTSNFITEEGLNNSSAKLFPSGTILVAMYGATAGKVSFLTFEASTNQAICAIMLTDIRMRYYLKNVIEDLYQYLVKLSTGSARDNLSQDMIRNIKVVIPSNDILDRFYDFSNNIIKEITKKQQENEQLTQLRDWLLPMLMNGQVKVG